MSVITKDHKGAKNLSKNDKIIVCKPNKGNGVVILNKVTYLDKMTEIVLDVSKIEHLIIPLQKYTQIIEDEINNFLRKVKEISNVKY